MRKEKEYMIVGESPFLFHAFRESALDRKKPKSGTTGVDPSEWKETVVMTEDRDLYCPNSYLFGAMKGAGKYSKIGRGNIVAYVASTLKIKQDKIFFGLKCPEEPVRDETQEVYLDVRSVVNPMTKGRNLRFRVALKAGWALKFTAEWDTTVLSEETMDRIVKDAGTMVGIGCGRSIGFGRFKMFAD